MFKPLRTVISSVLLMLVVNGCSKPAAVHLELAKNFEEKNDFTNAVKEYQEAANEKPSIELYLTLGKCILQTKSKDKDDDAEAAFKKAVAMDPHNVPAHIVLGNFYLKKKDTVKAKQEFDAANLWDPKNIEAIKAQGQIFEAEGDLKTAIQRYRDAIKLAPTDPEPHQFLGLALGRMNEFDEAKKEMDEVQRLTTAAAQPK